VPEFGPSCRREGFEASLEPRLHLIEVHDVEANPSSRRRRGALLRVAVIQSAPCLVALPLPVVTGLPSLPRRWVRSSMTPPTPADDG
jgi:hypothetical protein